MLELIRDHWQPMRKRRRFRLVPPIMIMLSLSLLVITQGTVPAPFIYAIF